jgi:hypothetical protein
MTGNYSKTALIEFTRYTANKGLIKASTARTWRIAVTQLLTHVSEAEDADVRNIDIESVTRRYANRNPQALKPESLATYQRRLALAIHEFVKWVDDPANYKPFGLTQSVTKPASKRKAEKKSGTGASAATDKIEVLTANDDSGSLPLPFPIRSNFLAQVVVPRDLTVAEARRIGAFLETVAVDFTVTGAG